jgi:protocatechuate 3,4-dioxygenase beta subunit
MIDMRKLILLFALTVSVAANAAITGTVVDADQKPISGATIRAYAAEGSAAMRARLIAGKLDREPLAETKSADNGSYSIELKSPAAVDVIIEGPGSRRITIPSVDGDDLGVSVFGPVPTRTWRVTSGGKPVANAIVVSGLDVSRTDASGEVPATGNGQFVVVHPDYAIGSHGMFNTTEVKLSRGVAVRGRVINASGPVAHAIISINGWPLAESGDDGTFAIAHAPESWQSVSAMHANEAGSANRTKAASLEIRLGPAATFTGAVRDAKRGGPVAGARMTLSGGDDVSMVALSDAKGSFTFAPLLPRGYQISGLHPAYEIESASATVPATRSRAFSAQAFARAKGRVIDEDKKPVAGALISASSRTRRMRVVLTNATGEFSTLLSPSPGAPLPIYASKRDYVTGSSASRIWQPGETRDNIAITLAHGFLAQVRVLDKQEQPVPNAQVTVMHVSSEGPGRSEAAACADPAHSDCNRTGKDGLVSFRTVEGPHNVQAFGDDIAPVMLPNQKLTARSAAVVVHVDRGIEISGHVVHADGTPVVDAIVEAPTPIMRRSVTTGPDGTFKLAGIARGQSVLTAFSSDRRLASTPQTITAPAKDVTITMPQGARIEGRILDRATQQPVADFSLLLPARNTPGVISGMSSFAGGAPTHSDDGSYALDNVPPGNVQLQVSAQGYVAGSRNNITVEDGKTVSGIDIQLDRGAAVSGRVTSSGNPVAGAQVRVAFQRSPNFNNVTSDADGLYRMDGLGEGDHTVEFQKAGFIILQKPVVIAAGKDIHLDVELDPGHELRGRVVDRSGQGVVGAYVSPASRDGRPAFVTSDGDGNFVLQGLADGTYKIVARKDGFVSAESNDVVLPQSGSVTLTMDKGATITGRVTGLAPDLIVQVIVTASGGMSRNQTNVDAGGAFSLPGMPDGRVRVDAILGAAQQHRSAPYKTIDIENGIAPNVELNFDEGITVTGHVTKGGAPLPGGNISFAPKMRPANVAAPASTMRQMANATIGLDGNYVASGLSAGDYDVRIFANGVSFSTTYTVVANAAFDVDIKGAMLRGHVVDASTGSPVANARVSLSSRLPAFGAAVSDSDGRFSIDALVDATYNLQVRSDQYATSSQQIVVTNGSAPDVEVRLEQAPAVTIHVVDSITGAPVDGNVAIMGNGQGPNGQAERTETGVFKAWLKPGTYNVSAYARGYLSKRTTFTTPPAEVTIPIARGGSLQIRARSAQVVRLDNPGGGTQRVLGPLQVGMNGPYDALPPGSYLLSTLSSDQRVIRSVPVAIVPGETVTVDLP